MAGNFIKLVECPRDAMQGWKTIIPTSQKIEYLQALLEVGFDTIDAGSFVSPKAIPQMADTKEVIRGLKRTSNQSKILVIVANTRGAEEAVSFEQIDFLGFPFSVSETFQQRNTNSSIYQSLVRVEEIQNICSKHNKKLVVYLSMGFGNPYGDPYSEEIVFEWADRLVKLGVPILSLADTVGLATPEQVFSVTHKLVNHLPYQEIGVHLHSSITNWKEKLEAALKAGCRRFDGALKGIGGCPMADDILVGNMDTELMIDYFMERKMMKPFNKEGLQKSLELVKQVFS